MPSPALHEPLESRRLLAALVSGHSVTNSTGTNSQVDAYTITVGAKQRYMIAALGKTGGDSGFAPQGQIIRPGGSTITFTGTTSTPLTVAGTYTIQISDAGANATGSYRLTAFISNGAQDDDDSNDFSDTTDNVSGNSGQRSAATADIGDLDVWRIDAKKGQAITVTVVENDAGSVLEPTVWLLNASGNLVDYTNDTVGLRLSTTATDTGAYYAVVADNHADTPGIYGITFTRVPGVQYTGDPDTGALSPGTTRNGDLPAGDADVFSIYVAPGQQISLDMGRGSGSTLDLRAILYDPSGKVMKSAVGNNASSGNVTVTATASLGGTHYLALFDDESDSGGTYTIDYSLTGSGGNGTAPADGRLALDGTSGGDSIVVRHRTISGTDTLEYVLNGSTKRYYAAEVQQLAISSGDGSDSIDMSDSDVPTYVSAGSGDDTIHGSSGNDSLVGGAGRNRLYGGAGDDRLNGSNGRDLLFGEDGNDRLYGSAGDDLLDGGGNNDRLFGGDGNDSLLGGNGIDKLYANAGNDTLDGGHGKDKLRGDEGNDLLHAKDGEADELYGGGGTDRLVDFDSTKDTRPSSDIEVLPG